MKEERLDVLKEIPSRRESFRDNLEEDKAFSLLYIRNTYTHNNSIQNPQINKNKKKEQKGKNHTHRYMRE